MNQRHRWERKFVAEWPSSQWKDLTILVAISGGGDSIALARGLLATRRRGEGRILAAHFNHGLRGAESDEDARFVAKFCRRHRVPLKTGHLSGKATAPGMSEERARNARYAFLRRTAESVGARYVVTGHTMDDQVETVLQRLFRGTGLSGLAGIPRARRLGSALVLLRPLLNFRRDEIREYLDSLGQAFREDATNAQTRFTRNRIRHELLPYVREHLNDHADEAIVRLAELAGQTQAFVEASAESLLERAVVEGAPDRIVFDRRLLDAESPFLVRQSLVMAWRHRNWPLGDMTFGYWQEILNLIRSKDPDDSTRQKRVYPGKVTVEVRAETVQVERDAK